MRKCNDLQTVRGQCDQRSLGFSEACGEHIEIGKLADAQINRTGPSCKMMPTMILSASAVGGAAERRVKTAEDDAKEQ